MKKSYSDLKDNNRAECHPTPGLSHRYPQSHIVKAQISYKGTTKMEIFTMTEQDIDKLIRYVISCKDKLSADDSFDVKDVLIASGIFDAEGLGLEE